MSAYVIMNYLEVHDEARLRDYRRNADILTEKYGGRVLVRPGRVDVREGMPTSYMIVTEFDSMEEAVLWYESDEYREARKIRRGAADVQVMLVEGVD